MLIGTGTQIIFYEKMNRSNDANLDPKFNDEMEKYIQVCQESQKEEDKSSHVGCLSACLI